MTDTLGRAVTEIALGAVRDRDRRRENLRYDSLGELEHQFQIPVSGTASTLVGYTDATLTFDVAFYNAQEQRDSPLDRPHFTYGAELQGVDQTTQADAGAVVACHASLHSWTTDDRGAFIGAIVRIGIWLPGETLGAAQTVDFDGLVHVRFQGYGAVNDDAADIETS